IPAHIVMPSNSSKVKVNAVREYGGQIVFCDPTQTARELACAAVIEQTRAPMIHPFENEQGMAGQGTAVLELLEGISNLDLILCPVGGGGLLCGTAVAAKGIRSPIKVIATEPVNADDASQSFHAGQLVRLEKADTFADGLRTNIGAPNFSLIQR